MSRKIVINAKGQRVGEGHHMARLKDAEVEQLIADRGPDDKPKMSYTQLALKYGIGKSSVRDYLTGRRRAQYGKEVKRTQAKKVKAKRVRINYVVSLHTRAKLARLGGGAFIEQMIEELDERAPTREGVLL